VADRYLSVRWPWVTLPRVSRSLYTYKSNISNLRDRVNRTGGGENLAIFDKNRRLSRKRCQIGRWLLWNDNRKYGCRIKWYNFRWPWVTPNPYFKVTVYAQGELLSNIRTKLLKNTNMKPYAVYRMVPLSMTLNDLWPRFQGHDIFRHWISQKRHSVSNGDIFRSRISRISQKTVRFMDKVSIEH